MTDYHGFWQGFLLLFAVLPAVAGASIGVVWGWRNGRRRWKLVPAALLSAGASGALVLAGAILIFRA